MFWFGVVLLLVSVIALVIVIISNSRAYNSQISQAEVEAFLIRSGIARKADLRDPSTAQSKAVSWLVNTDRSPVAVPQGGEADAYFLQRYIVLVLFYMTGGELWTNKWSMIEPREQVCNWNQVSKRDETYMYGVECEAGIATAIRIPATNLAGSLPNELGYLSSLKVVDLHDNALTGTLPRGLQRLTSCEYLALQHNQLLGTIPYWLGSLTNLEVLGLGDNVFDGAIPSTFQHLTNLVTLGLDDNGLDGDFSYLRFLKKMERLYLDTNSFEQPLATNFFAEMSDLKELDLSDNQLFGPIPYDMFEYTKLSILDLNSNSLEGQLPLGLYNNDVLELLSLSHNDLTGPILETISNLARLKHLDLAGNKFSGDIPNSITTMTNLRYLFVGDNPFSSGTIPGNLYHLSNLEDLSFKGSQRTGLIPDFFPQLQKLVFLDLDDNDFVGGIPESIGELTELRFLFLNRNDNLAGTVPVSVQDLPKLSEFVHLTSQISSVGILLIRFLLSPRYYSAD
jgi:Leucine-rich repeat (LRR) protein